MQKTLYYLELISIQDLHLPNTIIKQGDVLYYNNNASSNEMYIYNQNAYQSKDEPNYFNKHNNLDKYKGLITSSHLPFTRTKNYAKKYKSLKHLQHIKTIIDSKGDFITNIKSINITYQYTDNA
jgi:ABC-type metal ion transport system substrate-binding protein